MSQSYSVTNVIPLPVSTVPYLNDVEKENEPIIAYETIGGILLDTKYIWTANGSQFTVINSKTGFKVAAWNFGSVVKDYSTKVICVDELSRPVGKLPLLVIGLASGVTGGMICIFEITGSRVLRAIQIEEKVTSLHVIDASYDKCPLPGPLRAFDGILSVGTAGGNVLLLDICRHTSDEVLSGSSLGDIRDEINSCSVKTLYLEDIYSLELYKQVAIKNGEHLAIHLNAAENNVTPHFILKGPKGEDRVHVNKAEVVISALHYCPQLGSLLVGYNFGAWQLWNLIDLQLMYTSPIYEENVPVAYFSIQEPCDDPRAFSYVWVIYSNSEPYHASFPLAVLYSLNYDTKEWHEGYGILYQDLLSCSVRFQTDLTLFDEINTDNVRHGAYCLRLQSINKTMSKGGTLQELQEETISLCSIVWNGWSSKFNMIHTYMSLFDLNQWYKAQMPNSPRLKQCGTYMTHICLSKLLPVSNAEPTPFLDLRIDLNTLSQFFGSHKLEEHYYPTSLAFKLCGLRKNDLVFFNNPGSQRALLSHLESTGPSILLKPAGLFQQSFELGLYPLFVDMTHNASIDHQRELILSIALEQKLLGWLCRCASIWSNGNYSTSGCTLQFLISWGWQRALVLKQNADRLSMPLFDYSGLRLDANNHHLLSNCARQLKNLATLFGYIIKRFARFLLHPDAVKEQWESLQMVSVHLEVLQWLLNVGLLPECPISSYPRADEFNRISAPYPVDSLMKYYDERRTQLQCINKEHFSTSGSLLFIDNLIELECGGQKVQKQWEEDDGNGLYPPPSLQALLRTYLIEGVEISFKHCIVVYVFLDLAMTLDQSRYKPIITHLIKFPAVFQLSPSIIKITQAFWQLDHGDFSTAMEQLLDPLVCAEDLKIWHHRVALKALLAQNQHKYALLYLQVRQPAVTEVEDLCTVLSLFIVNNMLDEAFHFQRQNRSVKNEEKLLHHFYRECDRKGEISSVIHLPLMETEEKAFMKYLQDVDHPKLQDLQVFYYIQRSQYVDAFELNDKLNIVKHSNKGLKGQDSMGFRDLMVKEFTDTLPAISKSLMKFCQEENPKQWKEVARPEPFSVFVHNTNEQAKYKSTVINTVLSKAKETWTHPILNATPKKDKSIIYPITEEMPFLNTPKALHSKSRIATPVIFPKISRLEESCQDEDGPSPAKRFKVSPRLSMSAEKQKINIGTNSNVTCSNLLIKLDTPIVKRKVSRKSSSLRYSDEKFSVGTPQSILKVYNLVRNSGSPNPVTSENKNATKDEDSITVADEVDTNINKSSSRKLNFGLTPRKPLPRTPRYGVRFDISRGSSESSITSEPSFEIIHDEAMIHSSHEGIQKRLSELKPNTSQQTISEMNSKNSSISTDGSFYSPNASVNSNTDSKSTSELQSIIEIDESKVLNQQVSKDLNSTDATLENKVLKDSFMDSSRTRSYKRHLQEDSINVAKPVPDDDVSKSITVEITPAKPSSPKTPKSRRSYRGSLPEVGIRSSPRLRKSLLQTFDKQQQLKEKEISQQQPTFESSQSTEASELLPEKSYTPLKSKLKGRRPLSRQVLENNAFSKAIETSTSLQASPLLSSQSRLEVSYSKAETTFESKKTVKVTEEYKGISISYRDLDTSKASLSKFEQEDSIIISSNIKLDDTKSTSEVDSANVSYNELDIAYTSDVLLQASSEESSIKSDRDNSVSPLEQIADNKNVHENSEEVDEKQENVQQLINKDADQQEDSNAESEEEQNEISSKTDTKSKVKCDSDSETVVLDSDLLVDTANIYDDLSSENNYGSTDPQMNVFEISDDLDLNEDMCVVKNVDVLEIDVNYTTSPNDEEVFADKSELLTDVISVNDYSSVQFEPSETDECNKTIQELKAVPLSEEVVKENNEIIELVSSSDESNDTDDDTDRNSESTGSEKNDSSIEEEEDEEEEEIVHKKNEENSDSEHSQSASNHSEHDLVNQQIVVSHKEVLSDSEYSRNSEIMSDDNSRESYSSKECHPESAGDYGEIKEVQDETLTTGYRNSDVEEFSNEITVEISEDMMNIGQLDVIPEETSDASSEGNKTNSKSRELADNTHLDLASTETSIKSEIIVENCQLEVSEVLVTESNLTVIPEEISEDDVSTCKVLSTNKQNTIESSERYESIENSSSMEQQTVIEAKNAKSISKQSLSNEPILDDDKTLNKSDDVKLPKTRSGLNQTDILDSTGRRSTIYVLKSTSKDNSSDQLSSLDSTASDILDKCEYSKSKKNLNLTDVLDHISDDVKLNKTDILDTKTRRSTIYILKSGSDDNSSNQLSFNVTSLDTTATSDILDKSEYSKPKENLNVLNQTDVLDHISTTVLVKENEELQSNVTNDSQLFNEVLKDNLEKSSTPARRSRRLSSLQHSTPSDQVSMRRTRRSASFDISQKNEDISQPSTSKDSIVDSASSVKPRRSRSNSIEVAQTQVSSPRTKRGTTNVDSKEIPLRKRILRSSSTDTEIKESETKSPLKTRTRRALSVNVDLPVIQEELKHEKSEEDNEMKKIEGSAKSAKSSISESGKKKQTVKQPRKSKSTVTAVAHKNKIQEYSATRRLTRRQAGLLQKTLGASEMDIDVSQIHEHEGSESEESEVEERGPAMSKLDPIHLLDKPSFDGKHDSDEEQNIQQSPPSSVPESPISSQKTRRLRGRSSNASPRSETSTVPSLSEASVSSKRKLAKHPITGISTRTRSRSKSVEEKSNDMPSPPKLRKTRQGSKDQTSGSDVSSVSKTRSLVVEAKKSSVAKRTRSASVQLSDEAGHTESPLRRSERCPLLTKSELPQIDEEQSTSSANAVPKANKRNLRKRSSAK